MIDPYRMHSVLCRPRYQVTFIQTRLAYNQINLSTAYYPPRNDLRPFLARSELYASSLTATKQHSNGDFPCLSP